MNSEKGLDLDKQCEMWSFLGMKIMRNEAKSLEG